jgi:hypothetical protein
MLRIEPILTSANTYIVFMRIYDIIELLETYVWAEEAGRLVFPHSHMLGKEWNDWPLQRILAMNASCLSLLRLAGMVCLMRSGSGL